MLPDWAVMFVASVLLTVSAVANPELSIVATAVFEDVQVTALVKSTVVPSWRSPIASNCCVCPAEIEGLVGVTEMEFRFATVTVTLVEPLIAPEVALMVAVPSDMPFTKPFALTVATDVLDDVQLAESVRSFVLPSS